MGMYLFVVLGPGDNIIWTFGDNTSTGLMKTAHDLVDQFSICGAERCQIWARTGINQMCLLGTAF